MDILEWAPGLCARLGIDEPDDVNLALGMWAQTEGMPDSANNVLAATDRTPHSRDYNSAGVQIYPSVSVMNRVYADKLQSGEYRGVFNALDDGNLLDIYHAINRSPWCHGCQGGNYPSVLHDFLVATGALPGATFTRLFNNPPGQTGPAPEAWDIAISVARANFGTTAKTAARHAHNFGKL